MHSKILSSLLLLGLLAVFSPIASAAQPAGQIISARVRGQVYVVDKATKASTYLTEGATLTQGSIVTTAKGASVVLVFSNGATLSLGTDSALDIETFTQDPFTTAFSAATAKAEPTTSTTKLNLTKGELVSKVAKLNTNGGSTFTVGTPVGAAGIRGTIFRIVYIPDGAGHASFSLVTLEGSVLVTLATGTVNTPVVVSGGKEVALTVEINVDASGVTLASLPAGTPPPTSATTASPATTAEVSAAAQLAAQAIINIITPATPATPTTVTAPDIVTPIQTVNTSVVSPSS